MLIVDRHSDLLTPLLQNNSLSSLYYHKLHIKDNLITWKVKVKGEEQERQASLVDEDPIWLNYKYLDYRAARKDIK